MLDSILVKSNSHTHEHLHLPPRYILVQKFTARQEYDILDCIRVIIELEDHSRLHSSDNRTRKTWMSFRTSHIIRNKHCRDTITKQEIIINISNEITQLQSKNDSTIRHPPPLPIRHTMQCCRIQSSSNSHHHSSKLCRLSPTARTQLVVQSLDCSTLPSGPSSCSMYKKSL